MWACEGVVHARPVCRRTTTDCSPDSRRIRSAHRRQRFITLSRATNCHADASAASLLVIITRYPYCASRHVKPSVQRARNEVLIISTAARPAVSGTNWRSTVPARARVAGDIPAWSAVAGRVTLSPTMVRTSVRGVPAVCHQMVLRAGHRGGTSPDWPDYRRHAPCGSTVEMTSAATHREPAA